MSVNNTICRLAQMLGLKDTKEETIQAKRNQIENDVRQNEERREAIKDEMTDLDNELRNRKEEYLKSAPGIQAVVRSQILSLKKERDYLISKLGRIAAVIDNRRLLLRQYDALLFAARNPVAVDEMEDVRDELEAWTDDLSAEMKASAKLADAGKVPLEEADADPELSDVDGAFEKAVNRQDPEFDAFLASIS